MINQLKNIVYRAYSDFLMPGRLDEYQSVLEVAIAKGYETHSVVSFWKVLQEEHIKIGRRYLILRHDVDTDTDTARRMFNIEKSLGVRASYYFRWSTIDIGLMNEIEEIGSEASYHYEEIATVAKRKCLKTREEVYGHMTAIRELFKTNLQELRNLSGLPMKTVASHGDFANRCLNVYNYELLADNQLRKELDIVQEAYDEEVTRHITSRHSDTKYPHFWKPSNPLEALQRGEQVVYILTHPRNWCANIKMNFKEDIVRLWEGIRYQFGLLREAR